MSEMITIEKIIEHKIAYMAKIDCTFLNRKVNFFEMRFKTNEIGILHQVCQDQLTSTEPDSLKWYSLQSMLEATQILLDSNPDQDQNIYKIPLHFFELEEYMNVFRKYPVAALTDEDRFIVFRIRGRLEIAQNMYRDIIKKYVILGAQGKLNLYLKDWSNY